MSTTKYSSPLCSCVICKEVKSAKGIHSHYLIAHTEEGKLQNLKNGRLGKIAAVKANKEKIKLIIESYNQSPNICEYCSTPIDYLHKNNRFCSHSCAAILSNSKKDFTKIKTGPPKGYKFIGRNIPQYSKFSYCVQCNSVIKHKYRKTCSDKCKFELASFQSIERIKLNKRSNYRRDKKSYLERSFEEWLLENHPTIKYDAEHTIHNHITKRWYFVDFYFPELNLIVELDGKQHERPDHKLADKKRDNYIQTHLGLIVFRISHDEYQTGIKIPELLKLLVG